MKISIKCERIIENSDLLAVFSALIDDSLVLKDIKLVKGENGTYVSFPVIQYEKDGEKKYKDLFYFMNEKDRNILLTKIKRCYEVTQFESFDE